MDSVAVVIPAFNAERYLLDALDSVERQTLTPHECIVIDDGSTDKTRLIAEQHHACTECISHANQGVSASRNRGAAKATGEMLAFLDADDAWDPRRLEVMCQRLRTDDVDAVLCSTWLCDSSLTPYCRLEMSPSTSLAKMLLHEVNLVSSSSSLLIRRESFEQIRGFNEEFATCADWYLLYRIVEQLRWSCEPEPLVFYRRHAAGMSRDIDKTADEKPRIYRQIFANCDPELLEVRRRAFAALHRVISGSYFVGHRKCASMRHAFRSLTFSLSEAHYFAGAVRRQIGWQYRSKRNGGAESQ